MKLKVKIFATLFALIFASGCAYLLEENVNESPAPKENTESAVKDSFVYVVKESIKVGVKILTRNEIQKFSAGRFYTKKDFEKILKDEYVNYAEGENAEILSLYNEYIHLQEYGGYYDIFGNEITPRNLPGPFVDDFGKIPYIVIAVVVENLRNDKIEIKPSICALLDDKRNQYRSLEIDDIIQTEIIPYPMRYISPYTVFDPFWAGYLLTSQRRAEQNKKVLRELLLRDEKIYPGVVRRGLVVFKKPAEKIERLMFIFPEVAIYSENEKTKLIDFRFEFALEK